VKGGAAISQTGERVDRDGTVDGMREGFIACLSPPAPLRPKSHRGLGHVGPSRRAPTDHLGCLALSWRLAAAAGALCTSWRLAINYFSYLVYN
jgi:hypothetical protein